MFRRTLLAAGAVLLLSAAPAGAQAVDYPPTSVLPTSLVSSTTAPQVLPTTLVSQPPEERVQAAGAGVATGGPLARTGANNTVPLVQAALVLLGGGTLLVLVARRRRSQRRATA